mgnify:CR=1 FL=1
MKKNKIITGIDIGTTKIAVIICEIESNENINIIGFGYSTSNGLRKGIVEDIDKTSKSISKALKQAEDQAEIDVESAYVGITGAHVKGINCTGAITIANNEYRDPAGEKISNTCKECKGMGKKQTRKKGQLSPQQVQSLLEAMNNQEKKVQDKVNAKKVKGVPVRGKKDW